MKYTLGEASKATGKSKTTISKAIKNGRISANKLENGSYEIDPSELHRVYPLIGKNTVENGHLETPKVTLKKTSDNSEILARLKLAEARLSDKDEIIDDLKQDRDKWRQQATALLDNKKEKRGFLEKLFSN